MRVPMRRPGLLRRNLMARAIRGYRQALGYALTLASESSAVVDESTLRALHFMLLGHDLSKSPGRYRTAPIYVRDERTGDSVYEGPRPIPFPHS